MRGRGRRGARVLQGGARGGPTCCASGCTPLPSRRSHRKLTATGLRAALAYSARPCRSPAPGRQPRAAIEACRGAYRAATNEASPGVGGVWAS